MVRILFTELGYWTIYIDFHFTNDAPMKRIDNKAYQSDKLDRKLLDERDVEMVSPHRKGQK